MPCTPRLVSLVNVFIVDYLLYTLTKSTSLIYIHYHQITLDILFKCYVYSYLGRIIGLTGNALPEDVEIFMKNGANKVFIKPLNKDMLLDELISMITT